MDKVLEKMASKHLEISAKVFHGLKIVNQ